MLYAVHLFPKVHTVNLNRSRLPCKPDIQNITDFRVLSLRRTTMRECLLPRWLTTYSATYFMRS